MPNVSRDTLSAAIVCLARAHAGGNYTVTQAIRWARELPPHQEGDYLDFITNPNNQPEFPPPSVLSLVNTLINDFHREEPDQPQIPYPAPAQVPTLIRELVRICSIPNVNERLSQAQLTLIKNAILRPDEIARLRELNVGNLTCSGCDTTLQETEAVVYTPNRTQNSIYVRCSKCGVPEYARCTETGCDALVDISARLAVRCREHRKKAKEKAEQAEPAPAHTEPPPPVNQIVFTGPNTYGFDINTLRQAAAGVRIPTGLGGYGTLPTWIRDETERP